MHIAEGFLPPATLAAGGAIAAAGTVIGLRRMDEESCVRVAVFSSTFFVASLLHIPIGPGSVHLVLNGLMGIILGWAAFPAILVALALQGLFLGFGGLTALGVNTAIMATPAVLAAAALRRPLRDAHGSRAFLLGFLGGGGAVFLSAVLYGLALATAGRAFLTLTGAALTLHVPVVAVEAAVTGAAVAFLQRVRPEVLAFETRRRAEGESLA